MMFAFLVSIPGAVMGALYNASIFGVLFDPASLSWLTDDLGRQASEAILAMRTGWLTSAIFGAITTPFILVTWHLISGLLHHLVLLLIGGAKLPVEATLRTSMYSVGVNFWAIVPVLGFFVGFWVTLCKVIGYSRVHQTEWWRALIAVIGPWCTAVCVIGVGTLLFFGAFAAAIG
jgi:hypothetical protein